MGDVDENTVVNHGETDLTDEVQDFRFLSNLSTTADQSTLPRRGEKDFEPHGTASQAKILEASRQGMHNALSFTRFHQLKSHIIAHYHPETSVIIVEHPKGQMFKSIGTGRFGGWIQLLPEEALYMVERGNLDMRVAEGDGMEAWRGIPLSVQHCYALLLGQEGLTAERYTVYTGLKRLGMAVQRAPTWDQERNSESVEVEVPDGKAGPTAGASGFFSWIYGLLSNGNTHKSPPLGPLVGIGCYRSFADIYRLLYQIPYYDAAEPLLPEEAPSLETESTKPTYASLRPCFNVWKPAPDFKKSTPGEPDFRIVVVNARESNFPVLGQLDKLFMDAPANAPPARMENQLNQKLKHGSRNTVLAVVDQGVTSFLRLAEGSFRTEKLYERKGVGRAGGLKKGYRKKKK